MKLIQSSTENKGPFQIKPTTIVLHWWDKPAKHPTLSGTVSWFQNSAPGGDPDAAVSAHYVVSDETVVQMMDETERAWHALSANDYAIGIEVDPNIPGRTLETVAELIRDIDARRGQLPIVRHRDVPGVSTDCPGTLDVEKIISLARGGESDVIDLNYEPLPKLLTMLATGWPRPDQDGGEFMRSIQNNGVVNEKELEKILGDLLNSPQRRELIDKLVSAVTSVDALKKQLAAKRGSLSDADRKAVEAALETIKTKLGI